MTRSALLGRFCNVVMLGCYDCRPTPSRARRRREPKQLDERFRSRVGFEGVHQGLAISLLTAARGAEEPVQALVDRSCALERLVAEDLPELQISLRSNLADCSLDSQRAYELDLQV